MLAVLAGLACAAAADPHTHYMLDCMGCHRADGEGVPGKVPDMRNSLVPLSLSPAGRRFLIQVPGDAQAPLSDVELAALLNWMVHHLSAVAAPRHLRPFTAKEVARYRKTPLIDVSASGAPAGLVSRRNPSSR